MAKDEEELELFVPGRVCLLGEHTDWAGGFRRFNREIVEGYTLVTGTNQGIYARVKKHPSMLVATSTDNSGKKEHLEVPMDADALLKIAREGGHWSYVAGVAYKMLEENVVGGIVIDNYMTTLPLGKGLSSSAAICVLTARAFNKLYELRFTTRGEMEYAYQGELVTPSQCGRLDQACAFGSTPVRMTYDGEFLGVDKINVCMELHMVVVDLCAAKSTPEILSALQSAYPFPQTQAHRDLHRCLGEVNKDIVGRAMRILSGEESFSSQGKAIEALGALFREAQEQFDRYAGAVCPSQLTAPVLHRCLEYEPLQKWITGGKGVGAGGDGTAQLLCRDAEAQTEVARIVKDELHMDPILLTISPSRKIQTAVIPAGGFAGTLFPASQACKAELFPIYDPADGLCKPLILGTVEQLLQAGLERVILVIQAEDMVQFTRLFQQNVAPSNARKLPEGKHASYAKSVIDMGRHVQFVVQERQLGYGHAVFCARDLVGDNPFLLVLGHHVYLSNGAPGSKSCVEQMLDAHTSTATNVVGLKRTGAAEVDRFGTATGSFRDESGSGAKADVLAEAGAVLNVTSVVEKPSREFAERNLRVSGLPEGEFLTMFGMYALDSQIFRILAEDVAGDARAANGEIAFTPALDRLRQQQGLCGLVMDGERLPINSPESFIRTNQRLLERSRSPAA